MIKSNKLFKICNIAYYEALKSNCKMKHGAVITKGPKIICKGCNSSRSKYLNSITGCLHAEISVAKEFIKIIKRKKCWRSNKKSNTLKLNGYKLFVIRASLKEDDLKIMKYTESRPCQKCTQILKNIGFKKIIYSDVDGNINCVNLNTYHNNHLSDFQKSVKNLR